jgi:cell division protein FtsI/penicillin-binding protein 2
MMQHEDRLHHARPIGLAMGVVLILRLLWVQVFPAQVTQDGRRSQHQESAQIDARRGTIYDRNLGVMAQTVADGSPAGLNAPGVRGGRRYEVRDAAAHVVGFIGRDGHGLEGVEFTRDPILTGTPGRVTYGRLADHRAVELDREDPVGGRRVVVTLDQDLQRVAFEALRRGVEEHQANSGSAIVLDPLTGEVLAMTNYPSFDPGHIPTGHPASLRNRAITDALEPGSVFKVVAFAAAIEEGLFAVDDTLDCGKGRIRLGRHTIRDVHRYDRLSFADVLVHSSNVGTIRVAQQLGARQLYLYAKRFGFGEPTGIDLPGESRGLINVPGTSSWSGLSSACLAIGQEVSVTTLQMAVAMGVFAADGALVEPHIVLSVAAPDGRTPQVTRPRKVRQVISKETAREMTRILTRVVSDGTGKSAAIEGVLLAGKTGTAQRANPEGGYEGGGYNSTFVGFFADRQPPLVIAVAVIDPQKGYFGSEVAAPIFREIAQTVARRDAVLGPTIKARVTPTWVRLPRVEGRIVAEAREELRALGLKAILEEQASSDMDVVLMQEPSPGARVQPGDSVLLRARTSATRLAVADSAATLEPAGELVAVPQLDGLTLREAHQKLLDCGLRMRLEGSGRVVGQMPAAGHRVALHTTCVVRATPATAEGRS